MLEQAKSVNEKARSLLLIDLEEPKSFEEKARSQGATWLGDPVPAIHVAGEDQSRGHIESAVPPQHRADMLCIIEFSLINGNKNML